MSLLESTQRSVCEQYLTYYRYIHPCIATSHSRPKDPAELLQLYYEAQKSAKNPTNAGSFPAAKKKKMAEGIDEVLVNYFSLDPKRPVPSTKDYASLLL